jgi:hypothetical protein
VEETEVEGTEGAGRAGAEMEEAVGTRAVTGAVVELPSKLHSLRYTGSSSKLR